MSEFDWRLRESSGGLVGEPRGRVDETTWERFSEALVAAVRQAAASGSRLIVDLSGLDYMSSRGLRVLTIGKREAGDAVAISLAAPNPQMREILQISRYDKLFKVVDSVDAES